MARGAGEQLGLAVKLVEEHGAILKAFEFKQAMFNGKNNFLGHRYFDIIVEINIDNGLRPLLEAVFGITNL